MSLADLLPPSLNLPPHLSAHKYFFVCTLTVAAWDTLVLSPRTWRLWKTPTWPLLKILYHILRVLMPAEFITVGVAFFDTGFSQQTCQTFYLFEPICTAFLLAICSAIHVIRMYGLYDKNRYVLLAMSNLLFAQVAVTGVASGFFHSVPLLVGQGCIAGPKHDWVGIYWVAPTLLYTASMILAINRTVQSSEIKATGLWHIILRDNLNIYVSIWLVNMINMLFFFIATPTGPADSIKTIVTSMTAVLTTTMSMRIVLGIRGSLDEGGSFSGTYSSTAPTSSRSGVTVTRSIVSNSTPHTRSTSTGGGRGRDNVKEKSTVYNVDVDADSKASVHKAPYFDPETPGDKAAAGGTDYVSTFHSQQ